MSRVFAFDLSNGFATAGLLPIGRVGMLPACAAILSVMLFMAEVGIWFATLVAGTGGEGIVNGVLDLGSAAASS